MNLWDRFLQRTTASVRPEDARFLRAVESIERTLKRRLTGSELRVVFSLDDEQAALLKILLEEARSE